MNDKKEDILVKKTTRIIPTVISAMFLCVFVLVIVMVVNIQKNRTSTIFLQEQIKTLQDDFNKRDTELELLKKSAIQAMFDKIFFDEYFDAEFDKRFNPIFDAEFNARFNLKVEELMANEEFMTEYYSSEHALTGDFGGYIEFAIPTLRVDIDTELRSFYGYGDWKDETKLYGKMFMDLWRESAKEVAYYMDLAEKTIMSYMN